MDNNELGPINAKKCCLDPSSKMQYFFDCHSKLQLTFLFIESEVNFEFLKPGLIFSINGSNSL